MIDNQLAKRLLPLRDAAERAAAGADPAHDLLHVLRVTENARRIAEGEGADLRIVLPAALLHELFNYPKGHPQTHRSGEVCAERAAALLRAEGWGPPLVEAIAYAIRVPPFSAGIAPATLEAKVLQDADRLDAIGAIGIARCFATCSSMGRPFYDPADPFCETREPDDKRWGLDHFYRKLLRIPDRLHTETARRMAEGRVAFLERFIAELRGEIGADVGSAP